MRANGTRQIMIFYEVKPPILEAAELKFTNYCRNKFHKMRIKFWIYRGSVKENILNPTMASSGTERIQMDLSRNCKMLYYGRLKL